MSEAAPPSPSPSSKPRSTRAVVGLVLLLLAVGVRVLLPVVGRIQVENLASASLNATLEIRDVDLSLLRGQVVLKGLRLTLDPDVMNGSVHAGQPLVEIEAIVLKIVEGKLLEGDVHLEVLEIRSPIVRIGQYPDGRFDIAQLQLVGTEEDELPNDTDAAADTDAEEGVAEEGELRIGADRLVVQKLRVEFQNAAPEPVAPITLELALLEIEDALFSDAGLEVASINLEDPKIQFALESLANPAPPVPSPAADEADTGPGLAAKIGAFDIRGAELSIGEDPPLTLTFDVGVERFGSDSPDAFPFRLTSEVVHPEDGSRQASLAVEGVLSILPLSFRGSIKTEDVPLARLARHFGGERGGWVRSGDLTGDLSIDVGRVADTEAFEGTAAGTVAIRALHVADHAAAEQAQMLLAFEEFVIDLKEAGLRIDQNGDWLEPPKVRLGRVSLSKPVARFTNVSAAETEAQELPEPVASSEGAVLQLEIEIAEFEVHEGRVEFFDRTTTPHFDGVARDIEIKATGVVLEANRVDRVDVSLGIDRAKLAIEGSLQGKEDQLDVHLERLDLRPFNSYGVDALGYEVHEGAVSVDAVVTRNGEVLDAQTKVTMHQLDVSELTEGRFEQLFGVSLPLGLALMRDGEGDITLSVPVSATRQGGDVDLTPIVLDAMRSAIFGALTSPLRVVGSLVPFGKRPSVIIAKALPGRVEFGERDKKLLVPLAKLLNENKDFKLILQGGSNAEDRRALAAKRVIELLDEGDPLPPVPDTDEADVAKRFATALKAQAEGAADEWSKSDAARRDEWLDAIDIKRRALDQLGKDRAEHVERLLEKDYGVDAEQIEVEREVTRLESGVIVELLRPE
jgi:hypothetical protein